jgi:hypothetical protein
MKKILVTAMMAAVAMNACAVLNWAYDGATVGSGYQAGWLVYMYQDVDDNTDLASLVIYNNGTLSQTDDMFTSISDTLEESSGNYFWENYGIATAGQFYAYSVIFNSASFETATQYIVVDSSTTLLPNTDGISNGNYFISSNNGTWKNIQAVPEPATAMLLALGGGLAWLVRLKQRFY